MPFDIRKHAHKIFFSNLELKSYNDCIRRTNNNIKITRQPIKVLAVTLLILNIKRKPVK